MDRDLRERIKTATEESGITKPDFIELLQLIDAERPDRIIVGHPRLLSGEFGAQARAAAGFAGRLRRRVEVPVDLVDERLTTAEATRRSRETGANRRSGTPGIDSLAASVLLEGYLTALAATGPEQ